MSTIFSISSFLYCLFFLRNIDNLKIVLVERTSVNELDIYFSFKDFIKKKIIKTLMILFYKKADKIIANSKIVAKLLKNLIFKMESRY